jgi:hypothetical protein
VHLTSGWRWVFTSLRRVCPSVCLGLRFGPHRYDQHFQDLCSSVDIGFTWFYRSQKNIKPIYEL